MSHLTIAITSYNRPQEVRRCVQSLLPLPEGVDVLVCDDCSPRVVEIREALADLVHPHHAVSLLESETNRGYDENVLRAIRVAESPYVMLLSDDDMLEAGCVENVLAFVLEHDPTVAFVRFGEADVRVAVPTRLAHIPYQRDYGATVSFSADTVRNSGALLYNAILFSGLVFRRDRVMLEGTVWRRFARSIYVQVAIFMVLGGQFGCWFVSGPGVLTGGDGESGFGLNPASVGERDLVDRSTMLSRLRYHRRLFVVVRELGELVGASVPAAFRTEYHLRAIAAFREARNIDRRMLATYWKEYREISTSIPATNRIAFLLLWVLPTSIANALLALPEQTLRWYRHRLGLHR